jgi:hypothetical protein
MARKKTPVRQKDAGGEGMLQKAAKAIGSVVGTLAVTSGLAHSEESQKTTGEAIRTSQKRLPATVKKRAKKAAPRKNPAVKLDRVRKK